MNAQSPLRRTGATAPAEQDPGARQDNPGAVTRSANPVLAELAELIRSTTECLEAAAFEYGAPAQAGPAIGRFATAPGTSLSCDALAMIRSSPHAISGISGCFDAGQFSERGEMRHVVGLRFSDDRRAFAGGYAIFRDAPATNAWRALHGLSTCGAGLALSARESRVRQRASADGLAFQTRMFDGLQCGTDAYWETDAASVIRNVVVFPARAESAILKALEGKSLPELLSSAGARGIDDFHDVHIELESIGSGGMTAFISGRTLPDGTSHGTARLSGASRDTQLTRTTARALIEKLADANRVEANLRREAELVLDGLSILTSGRAGREIFNSLLALLAPALEFESAVVLQRDWSGRVAAAAATSDAFLTLDWNDAGKRLFAIDEVAAT
ncbi:MAG TPA: hypothetical protein VLW75_11625, partial [Rhizomicrobium sp.]|nr:hypothetical protein [Rhizomicrobium sp.]